MSYNTPCAVTADLRHHQLAEDRGDREQEYIDEVLLREQHPLAIKLIKTGGWLAEQLMEDSDLGDKIGKAVAEARASVVMEIAYTAALDHAKSLLEAECEEYFEYPGEKNEVTADSVSLEGWQA